MTREKITRVRRPLWLALCLVSAMTAVPAHAKKKPHKPEPTWAARLSVEQAYTDNVRSAQKGPQEEGAFFTTLKSRVVWMPANNRWRSHEDRWMPSELALTVRGRVFADFSNRNTVEIRPRIRYPLLGGFAVLSYGYTPRRLRLEDLEGGDDVTYSAHRVGAGYEHKFGPNKVFKAAAGVELDWDEYDATERGRDAFRVSGWGELRYRVHPYFIPRVKVKYGDRDTRAANYDRHEWTVLAGFDSRLPAGVGFALRYKYQNRDYIVDVPRDPVFGTNTNFGRTDDIQQIETTLGINVPWVDGLRTDLRFKLRDGDSTRTSRIFQVLEYGIGVTYFLPN